MFQSIVFVKLFVIAVAGPLLPPANHVELFEGKIVGGESTTIDKYPYQVSIRSDGWHFCGGAIYKSNMIISAAHCFEQAPSEPLGIVAGQTMRTDGGIGIGVKKYVIHPKYDSLTYDYDVAIVMLKNQLIFSTTIQPLALALKDEFFRAGQHCNVSGWGVTSEIGPSADQLQAVSVMTIDIDECAELYKYDEYAKVTDQMLCAGEEYGGKDACQGDSGGPLVMTGRLIGIVSWGIGCARAGSPGVYANVGALREWIDETIVELNSA